MGPSRPYIVDSGAVPPCGSLRRGMETVVQTNRNPGCLIQILWFALVGVWAGELWIAAAWFLMVTIVGIPVGIAMLNYLPKVIALRDPSSVGVTITQVGDRVYVSNVHAAPQHPFLIRALYFVLIGWWLTALWMEMAYAICLTIIGLPLGFWMFDRVPALLTLKR